MKRIAIALLAAAGLAVSTARATHESRVIVRGQIHIGAPAPLYSAPAYHAAPVTHYVPASPRGYWQNVAVKTWVPERWTVGRDRWGRPVRYFEPGYFAYRTERVWVDSDNTRHRDVERGGYGYHR